MYWKNSKCKNVIFFCIVVKLIRGVAEELIDRMQKVKGEETLGLPYQYSLHVSK